MPADVAPAVATKSHRYRTAIAPLSLRCCCSCCCYAFVPLSHRYRSIVAPLPLLLLRSRTAITPVLLHCCSTVAPLSLHCRSAAVAPAVATKSHRYRTAIAPLSLCCCLSCCHYAVSFAIASDVAPLSLLLLRCRCCLSCYRNGITAAIDPAVTHGRRLKRQNQVNGFHR